MINVIMTIAHAPGVGCFFFFVLFCLVHSFFYSSFFLFVDGNSHDTSLTPFLSHRVPRTLSGIGGKALVGGGAGGGPSTAI